MDDSSVSQVSLSTVLSQKAYLLVYSKKPVDISQTVTNAIKSFPTPPLSPFNDKSKALKSEKNSPLVKSDKKNTFGKSNKNRKMTEEETLEDDIKEPKPIASKSGKSRGTTKVIKHLEKLADRDNINATSKTWKIIDRTKYSDDDSKRRYPENVRASSSESKLLAASLPDLMQHFSPASGMLY